MDISQRNIWIHFHLTAEATPVIDKVEIEDNLDNTYK